MVLNGLEFQVIWCSCHFTNVRWLGLLIVIIDFGSEESLLVLNQHLSIQLISFANLAKKWLRLLKTRCSLLIVKIISIGDKVSQTRFQLVKNGSRLILMSNGLQLTMKEKFGLSEMIMSFTWEPVSLLLHLLEMDGSMCSVTSIESPPLMDTVFGPLTLVTTLSCIEVSKP